MARFTIALAGQTVTVFSLFESTKDYCRDYLTEDAAALSVTVTAEDLAAEQVYLDEEADREGLRRRVFAQPFLERNFLQRRIAQLLLHENVLLLHGSAVALDGLGYLFTAPCGTGKSTHARAWRESLGAQCVNDDKPFLRLTDRGVLLCGSPWCGKHGLGQNLTVPLGGICLLERGSENVIRPLSAEDALEELVHQSVCPEETLAAAIANATPLWSLACTPTPEAAFVAHRAKSKHTP